MQRPISLWKITSALHSPNGIRFNSLISSVVTLFSSVGSSPALATCETSQVLLAGVPGVFSRGSPVFAPPTD